MYITGSFNHSCLVNDQHNRLAYLFRGTFDSFRELTHENLLFKKFCGLMAKQECMMLCHLGLFDCGLINKL